MKLKKGDNVIILSGKDKGKKGKVLEVLSASGKLVVEGVNVVKKHQKSQGRDKKGGIIEKSMPLDASNVAMVDPKKGVATRVGYDVKNGKKVRIAKKSGAVLN